MSVVYTTPLYKDSTFIKSIDLAKAQNFDNKEPEKFNEFYELSGLKNFIEHTLTTLEEEKFPLEAIFIENSTITTATEEGVLSAFTAFWEDKANASRAREVFQTQQKVIKYLQEKLMNVFWHPDFFIAPNNSMAYYSFIDSHLPGNGLSDNEQIITEYQNTHHKIITNDFIIKEENSDCVFGLNSFFEMNYADIINNKSSCVHDKGFPVDRLHLINHQLYHKHFQSTDNQKPSVFLSIPILCPYASGIKAIEGLKAARGNAPIYPGLGAAFIFLLFKKDIPAHQIEELTARLEDIIGHIFIHAKDYASYYSFSAAYLKAEQVKEQATKAAISQVMARNMSHNIGSHVLSKFVTKEEVTAVMNDTSSLHTDPYKPFPGLNEKNCSLEKMAWFNSYLRNRMDYLADIATGVPAMEVPRQLVADVIAGFDKNRILLNRISGTENFSYSLEVRDCRNCPDNCTSECCKLDGKNRDIPISIPNDVMGYHALYIMIENLIRNTAKHGGQKNDRHTKFILEVRNSPADNSMYEAVLYDDLEKTGNYTLTEEDKKGYAIQCEGKIPEDTMTETDWLVYKQNVHLNQSVLDEQNKLRHGAWGLIEMDVSAAYLRKLPPEHVDRLEYTLDVSNAHKEETGSGGKKPLNILKAINKNNCLGYRFHLSKPKELVIVDEQGTLWQELYGDKLNQLNEYGILALHTNTANPLDPDKRWLFDKQKVYPYPFLLIIPGNSFSLDDYIHKQISLPGENVKIRISNANLPTRIIVQGSPTTSIKNQWVAWCNKDCTLPEAIRSVAVKRNNTIADNTITDHAWRIWLANKFDCFDIASLSHARFCKYIPIRNQGKEFKVVLDNHGENIKKLMGQYDYYETYTSLTTDLVNNRMLDKEGDTPNPYFDKTEIFKFIDGIFTNIYVIDERVQQNANTYEYAGIKIIEHLRKTGILVPAENEIKLNATSFENGYLDKIKYFIKSNTTKAQEICNHIVVIHLGIIEKILEAEKKEKKKSDILRFINELNSIAQPGALKIIITSGRGKPDNLPQEIPFIGYSILSQYCIENRFKSFFNQAVQAARPLN